MPRYGCSTRQSGRFISGTPSGWLTPGGSAPADAGRFRRGANLEIKFQRIRLGMPSTLYESQTNLPAYPCPLPLPPTILSIFRSPCRLSFRHLRHLLRAGENATIEIKGERDVEEGCPFATPAIWPTGRFATKYRRPYLLSPRKLGTFFPPSLSAIPPLHLSCFIHSCFLPIDLFQGNTFPWRQIVVKDRSYVMRQGRRERREEGKKSDFPWGTLALILGLVE